MTISQAFGWKPTVALLVAPLVAWGITYAYVAPDVRERMIQDLGIIGKAKAIETMDVSDQQQNETDSSISKKGDQSAT